MHRRHSAIWLSPIVLCALAPAASAQAVAGEKNILAASAGGRVVKVTSRLDNPYWTPDKLIDGAVFPKSNGWASSSARFPQDLVFAFKDEKPRLIARVVINTKIPDWILLGRGAKDVEIFVSTDTPDGPWKLVAQHSLLNIGEPQAISFNAVECRYLKVRIATNWGSDRYVAIGEVEAYEAILGTGELDQLISRLEQLLKDLKRYREKQRGS